MSRKSYAQSELEVFASDCREICEKIEEAIDPGIYGDARRKKPVKGTWKQIEKRLDEAANTFFQIWHDIDDDQ